MLDRFVFFSITLVRIWTTTVLYSIAVECSFPIGQKIGNMDAKRQTKQVNKWVMWCGKYKGMGEKDEAVENINILPENISELVTPREL